MRSDGAASGVCLCIRALGTVSDLLSALTPPLSVQRVCACSLLLAGQAGWIYQEERKEGSQCLYPWCYWSWCSARMPRILCKHGERGSFQKNGVLFSIRSQHRRITVTWVRPSASRALLCAFGLGTKFLLWSWGRAGVSGWRHELFPQLCRHHNFHKGQPCDASPAPFLSAAITTDGSGAEAATGSLPGRLTHWCSLKLDPAAFLWIIFQTRTSSCSFPLCGYGMTKCVACCALLGWHGWHVCGLCAVCHTWVVAFLMGATQFYTHKGKGFALVWTSSRPLSGVYLKVWGCPHHAPHGHISLSADHDTTSLLCLPCLRSWLSAQRCWTFNLNMLIFTIFFLCLFYRGSSWRPLSQQGELWAAAEASFCCLQPFVCTLCLWDVNNSECFTSLPSFLRQPSQRKFHKMAPKSSSVKTECHFPFVAAGLCQEWPANPQNFSLKTITNQPVSPWHPEDHRLLNIWCILAPWLICGHFFHVLFKMCFGNVTILWLVFLCVLWTWVWKCLWSITSQGQRQTNSMIYCLLEVENSFYLPSSILDFSM